MNEHSPAAATADGERTLVARARGGDEAAFAQLVTRHGPAAFNQALSVLGDAAEAEDVAQEALVRAWRALPDFRGEAAFGTWLYRIVANLCHNRLPSLRRTLAADSPTALDRWPDERPLPEARLLTAEQRAELLAAVAALPPQYRLLIQLRHGQGLSYAAIAEVTAMPLGTVKTGLHRAHRRLQAALLAKEEEEDNVATG